MAKYIFRTTATMKPHNSKNWWIDRDIITEKRIEADNVNQALTVFAGLVEDNHYISISKTALKNKSEMFRDTASGKAVQVGFVITGKTEFQRDTGAWSTQYIDLWVEILTVVPTIFQEV